MNITKAIISVILLGIIVISLIFLPGDRGRVWAGAAYSYHPPLMETDCRIHGKTVIGGLFKHVIQKKDTLLDIARNYDLGINEIQALYPELDPWIPPEGMELTIPTQWILPEHKNEDIVINIAEQRLYYFFKNINLTMTFPIGIGRIDWPSPVGTFQISEKRKNPGWYIPASLQDKYNLEYMPPGPNNPLGDYWLGLGSSTYGIHGTNIVWSVGRMVTHGCIRLYPEDIESLYSFVHLGAKVKIVYEPVKLGFWKGEIYAEVHKDIYSKINNFYEYGYLRLKEQGLLGCVDLKKFRLALEHKKGLPVNISAKNNPSLPLTKEQAKSDQ